LRDFAKMNRKTYFTRPSGDDFMEFYTDDFVQNFMARTVYEDDDIVDIGVLDANGNKIMAKAKKPRIGFKWKD